MFALSAISHAARPRGPRLSIRILRRGEVLALFDDLSRALHEALRGRDELRRRVN